MTDYHYLHLHYCHIDILDGSLNLLPFITLIVLFAKINLVI